MSNVWQIRIADHTTWVASHNAREVDLGYPPKPGKHRLEITWNRSTQIHTFDLDIDGVANKLVLMSHSGEKVSGESEAVSIELQGRGFQIGIQGIGKVSYQTNPKQIDTSGFANEEWEEAMVWIVGTLMVIGFPAMLD